MDCSSPGYVAILSLRKELIFDAESENRTNHRCDIQVKSACAWDWIVLRVVDVDGAGGLTAVELVKCAAKG